MHVTDNFVIEAFCKCDLLMIGINFPHHMCVCGNIDFVNQACKLVPVSELAQVLKAQMAETATKLILEEEA
jgi:hypothetical protein